jgi:4-carboxymuconolactone decarboxylase
MPGLEETLARIALRDDRFISSLPRSCREVINLDQRTCALARLAALIALDGGTTSFVATVQDAQAAGASPNEIVATLLAVLPAVGVVRASSAAPKLALALGYELDPAFAENDQVWGGSVSDANFRYYSVPFEERRQHRDARWEEQPEQQDPRGAK